MNPAAARSAKAGLPQQVLVVDDEAAMRLALEVSFSRHGWQVETASGKADAVARFRQRRHSLVVTDIRMPDGDGFGVMREVREITPETAVILLTAFGSVPDAVSAMKSGACEYLVKPVAFEQLLDSAERICSRNHHSREKQDRKLVGSSPALRRAIEHAQRVARSDADILIQAESGTGKELLARMIHSCSARREKPFVGINCAAFPDALLESELFGHGRGAFTGAIAVQPGKFEIANQGTVLLDEIGEMPLSLQPKLLRVLQEREFYRLGEARPVKVDIRVIATTNRALASMVREGSFRADLYYRLNVIPLSLPPLRERREDIRDLALHFARLFAPAGELPGFSEVFLSRLEQHSWPGNVRELANLVRRTVALRQDNFEPDEFESQKYEMALPQCRELMPPFSASSESGRDGTLASFQPGVSFETMERRLLEMTLAATAGNRSRAAEMLGISLRTVRNKIREYNLPPRKEYANAHFNG